MPPLPAANATVYFISGDSLKVLETVAAIAATCPWTAIPLAANPPPMGPATAAYVTAPNGDRFWINMRTVERVGPA